MTVTQTHYQVLGALLFAIGVYGALTRRNAIGILMALELIFNAVNITLGAASRWGPQGDLRGELFALFVIAAAAAESVLGLALILAVYRRRGTADADDMTLLKG